MIQFDDSGNHDALLSRILWKLKHIISIVEYGEIQVLCKDAELSDITTRRTSKSKVYFRKTFLELINIISETYIPYESQEGCRNG